MNREQLIAHWKVIEKFKNGKSIQRFWQADHANAKWVDDYDPTFAINRRYRVKPEPVECWCNVYSNTIIAYTTSEKAVDVAGIDVLRTAVHLVEKPE